MTKTKINESFYPLTPAIARKLRETKLTAAEWRIWSYLAEVDPWGDRYQDLDTLTLLSECAVSKATFYRAIAKLQELDLFDFQDQGFSVRNRNGISKLRQPDSLKNETDSERLRKGYRKNETKVSGMRQESQNCENSLKNETTFSEMRQESQNCENQPPNCPPEATSSSLQTPQTFQTHQTNQTGVAGENFFWEEDPWNDQEETIGQAEGSQGQKPEVRQQEVKTSEEDLKEEKSQEQKLPVKKKTSRAASLQNFTTSQNFTIPQDLVDKLEELSIPLDDKVRKAIASHDISQAYGAAAHVENTWETINHPRSVFLYQLPKKPIEKKKQRFSSEFLNWYEQAIVQGIVEDVPPEYLPLDHLNQPKVRLPKPDPYIHAPYTLVEWRKLQADPDYDPNRDLASPEEVSKFFGQLRQKLGVK